MLFFYLPYCVFTGMFELCAESLGGSQAAKRKQAAATFEEEPPPATEAA
jgi:hypothetical protein